MLMLNVNLIYISCTRNTIKALEIIDVIGT